MKFSPDRAAMAGQEVVETTASMERQETMAQQDPREPQETLWVQTPVVTKQIEIHFQTFIIFQK